jgi:DedD protein
VKQRIMGLIILVAIALIFVPILFSRSTSAPIPATPQQAKNSAPSLALAAAPTTAGPQTASASTSNAPQQEAPDQVVFHSPDPDSPPAPEATTQTAVAAAQQPTEALPNQAEAQSANVVSPTPNNIADNYLPAQPNPPANVANSGANPAPTESTAVPPNPTAPAPTTEDTANASNSSANSNVTSIQPPAVNPQPQSTATTTTVNNGIAASESNVLSPERSFALTPAPNKKSAHHATIHQEQHRHPMYNALKKSPADKNHGWVIQLGSFAEQKNVEKLIQQLHAQGFTAHVLPIHTSHGTITRVYLGPEVQRQQAERIAKQINDHLAIHSIVVPA